MTPHPAPTATTPAPSPSIGAPGDGTLATPLLLAVPLDHPCFARGVRAWQDLEQVHKAVMSLFPATLPGPAHTRRADSSILFRVEPHARRVLVQTATAPIEKDTGIRSTSLEGLIAVLAPAMTVRFRVDVNAVRCQARTGKRLPVTEEEIPRWLADRLHRAVSNPVVDDLTVTVFRKGTTPLRVASVTGRAEVADPAHLHQLIRAGVGRARAYGCGLLSVAPVAG